MKDHAHVVLDQDDRVIPFLVQAAYQGGDLIRFLVAHAGRRLIEQQQPRELRERHRDFGGPLIAVRESANQPIGFGSEPHECQHFRGDVVGEFRIGLVRQHLQGLSRRDLRCSQHVFVDGQLGKDLGDLEGAPHAESDPQMRRNLRHVLAFEQDRPVSRGEIAADHIEEGGFAGSIGTDDGAELAAFDGHRHVPHSDQVAKPLCDVANLEHGQSELRRRRMPSRPRGKKSTTSTKIEPTKDIQFTVIEEM